MNAQIKAFVDGQNTTLGNIETSVTAIQALVTNGGIGPDDVTALTGVATRTQAVATSLTNIMTPPAPAPGA